MAPVFEIEGLRKENRRLRRPSTVALDGLDLEVTEGGVFGFLGAARLPCRFGESRPRPKGSAELRVHGHAREG